MANSNLLKFLKPWDGSTDVHEFVDQFETLSVSMTWNDKAKADNLPLQLTGNAKRRYKLMSEADRKDVSIVLKFLKKEFGKSSGQYFLEFCKLDYDVSEGPKSFGLRLEELLGRAFPELEAKTKEVMLIAQFVDKLPEYIRGMTKLSGKDKWLDLLNLVESSIVDVNIGHGSKVDPLKSEPFDIELNKVFYSKNRFEGTCFNCGKRGHIKSQCRVKRQTYQKEPESNKQTNDKKKFDKMLNSISVSLGSTTVDAKQEDNMLRVKGDIGLMKAKFSPIEMTMLVDSGASHSFVNPKFLSQAMKKQIRLWMDSKEGEKLGISYDTCKVNLVNSSEEASIIVLPLRIQLGDWTGEHMFLLSDIVMTEQMILGRDFLSKYDTVIYNKSNKLVIKDVKRGDVESSDVQTDEKELKSVVANEEAIIVDVVVDKKTVGEPKNQVTGKLM